MKQKTLSSHRAIKRGSPADARARNKNLQETCIWLRALLDGDRMMRVSEVKRAAQHGGFNWDTVKRAKKHIGVETYHQIEAFNCSEDWFWYYPYVV